MNSTTASGDVTNIHEGTNWWVVRISSLGALVWQKALGGTNLDLATALTAIFDGWYGVAGYTISTNGDVRSNNVRYDYRVVKLQSTAPPLRSPIFWLVPIPSVSVVRFLHQRNGGI
ncbi:hypothetical protein GCM10027592_47990 [Spirosoma flavus]